MSFRLTDEFINEANRGALGPLQEDYADLARQLARRDVDIERLTDRAMQLRVSVPSWESARAAHGSRSSPAQASRARSSRKSTTARQSIA